MVRPPLNAAGAYLAVLTNAVHGILVTAELHGVDFPEVGLPAHGTLMLLHVWENETLLSRRPDLERLRAQQGPLSFCDSWARKC